MVRACRVLDLSFTRHNMTWVRKRRTHTVECWLDRAMVNDEWKSNYPATKEEYLEVVESDNRSAIIKV